MLKPRLRKSAGWQRVRAYLSSETGEPRWKAFSDCENLIRTLPALTYDKLNREDAADGEDHAPEALRYALMSRPGKSAAPVRTAAKRFDPFFENERKSSFFGT